MMVKGIGHLNAKLLHHDEGNAVGQRVLLIVMTLEKVPACIEERFVNVD
jgi:hypothetical protein